MLVFQAKTPLTMRFKPREVGVAKLSKILEDEDFEKNTKKI